MALVVSGYVSEQEFMPRNVDELPASKFYLEIDPDYLEAYDLDGGDRLVGTIREIGDTRNEPVEELTGEDVTFVVLDQYPSRIFLSRETFSELREWGFVSEAFWLSAELTSAIRDEETIDIYTKRTVEA